MKKIISLLLSVLLVVGCLTGCSGNGDGGNQGGDTPADKPKIGVILVGDENEGYTYAHMEGIREAMKAQREALGLD